MGKEGSGPHALPAQTPVSMCSKDCQPGQKKKAVGIHFCCFERLDLPPWYLSQQNCRYSSQAHALALPQGSPGLFPFAGSLGSP